MLKIPHFKQLNDYYCGPAILQMTLAAYGISITQEEAAKRLGTTEENGTSVGALVEVLQKEGLMVTGGNNQTLSNVREAFDSEKVVLFCYTELHYQWDHFAILIKFDAPNIVLLDSAEDEDEYRLPLDEFEKRWVGPLFTFSDHWAIYISKAEQS